MRPFLRTRIMPRALAASLAAALLVTIAACASPADDEPASASLTMRVNTLFSTWDPRTPATVSPFYPQYSAVYDPLLVWDDTTNDYEPWLAESYTISDDELTLSLKLREGIDFTDGVHLNAEAVETYFDALWAIPGSQSQAQLAVNYDAEVTATGEYTVDITTSRPITDDFMGYFTFVPVVSPEAFADPELLATTPVGTGPYVVEEFIPDVSITYVRNPDYWNAEAFDFDTVVLKVFADDVAALNALKSGQIDVSLLDVPTAVEAEAAGLVLHEGAGRLGALFIADRDGSVQPALADVRVRQAMNLAFDRDAINESLNLGYGGASSQAFVEGQAEYIAGEDDHYPYDLDRARELMAEAGYADGFDLVIPSGEFGTGEFFYTVPYEPIVQQSLADIGIRVTFDRLQSPGDYFGAFASGEAPVAMIPIRYIDVQYFISAIFNPEGYGDAKVEELISIIQTGDAEERAAASAEFGQYILDEAWYVPFSKPYALYASTPDVEVDIDVSDIEGNPWLWRFKLAE